MAFIPTKTPLFVKKIFPKYTWDIPTTEKVIYLTFDDGPTPEITRWTLRILKEYNAKATFFCIGNNIENHPEIFNAIVKEGHAIGNHTQNHIKGWKTKPDVYLKNVIKAQQIINSQLENLNHINTYPKLFRPPYGQIKAKQANKLLKLGYKIIMWDILSFDWDYKKKAENCLSHILKKTVPGSIIVFHDSIKASKNMQFALPKVLEHYSKKGYLFKSLNPKNS